MKNINLVRRGLYVEQKPPPQIEGHSHYWQLSPYEKYISRGVCGCGAVWFFADTSDNKVFERVNLHNSKRGKGGKIMERTVLPGPPAPPAQETEEQAPSGLPPMPSKPDTTGLNKRKTNDIIHDYYEANKEAIMLYFDRLGSLPMRKAWGLSNSTWGVLRARWMPDRFQYPSWYKKVKPKTPKPEPAVVEEEVPAPSLGARLERVLVTATEVVAQVGTEVVAERPPPPPPGPQEYIEKGYPPHDPADTWWKHLLNWALGSREKRTKYSCPKLPTFPEFDSAWPEEVQLRWFDTYKELAK